MVQKLKTLPVILKLVTCVLGLIAFFMMFANQVKYSAGGTSREYAFNLILFGGKEGMVKYDGAVGGFIGYLLLLLGACAVVVPGFVDFKFGKYVTLGGAAAMLIGSILVFCVFAMFKGANSDAVKVAEALGSYKLAAGPVVGGIFGILGAASGAASCFVKAK